MNTHADKSQHSTQKASDTKPASHNSVLNPLTANLQSGNPLAPKEYNDNPLQLKSDTGNPLQKGDQPLDQSKPNNTGLTDNLKTGVENLSGYSMDDVKVHYNSDKPAQLQALAYAQGTDIHVGPGQEKHLPHEAWHVVQQKQGRVQPTMQMKSGVAVNDDRGLEDEADAMKNKYDVSKTYPQEKSADISHAPIQRMKRSKEENDDSNREEDDDLHRPSKESKSGKEEEERSDVNRNDVNRNDVNRNDVNRNDVNRNDVNRNDVNRNDVNRNDVNRNDVNRNTEKGYGDLPRELINKVSKNLGHKDFRTLSSVDKTTRHALKDSYLQTFEKRKNDDMMNTPLFRQTGMSGVNAVLSTLRGYINAYKSETSKEKKVGLLRIVQGRLDRARSSVLTGLGSQPENTTLLSYKDFLNSTQAWIDEEVAKNKSENEKSGS